MSNLIPFDYHGKEVRTVSIDGEPWFVAKDVIAILDIGNVTDALSRLDEDEKGFDSIDTLGGIQEMSIITESGLYSLTLGSKKPEAKPFKRWVTHDVIPAIRKTGSYSKPMTQAEIIAAQANLLVEVERKSNAALTAADSANKRLDNALDALATSPEPDWQVSTGNRIKAIVAENQLSYLKFFGDLYKELEDTAHVNLTSRVSRMKERMKKAGHTHKELEKITKLHVISCDPILKLAFDGIVRRYEAKYAIQRCQLTVVA
jgi:prophage antirepressor-like protein